MFSLIYVLGFILCVTPSTALFCSGFSLCWKSVLGGECVFLCKYWDRVKPKETRFKFQGLKEKKCQTLIIFTDCLYTLSGSARAAQVKNEFYDCNVIKQKPINKLSCSIPHSHYPPLSPTPHSSRLKGRLQLIHSHFDCMDGILFHIHLNYNEIRSDQYLTHWLV